MAARRKPSNAGKSVHGGYLAICVVCGCEYVERSYVDAVGGNCRCTVCRKPPKSRDVAQFPNGRGNGIVIVKQYHQTGGEAF